LKQDREQHNLFVLRNNDLGDVLVATPLLHGLRKSFPGAKISAGVGGWAKPLLKHNPDIDEILSCSAPWHNKQNCRFPANSPRTFLEGLLYVLFSKEARNLAKKKFTHGIDVLGSRQGAWLLKRAGIPRRFGVSGYAGGDKWCEKCVDFREDRKVADAALAFLPLLGAKMEVKPRPRIYLTNEEKKHAAQRLKQGEANTKSIIVAPGGGFPEKLWGNKRFCELTKLLLKQKNHQVYVIGSKEDRERIHLADSENGSRFHNLCGTLSLRDSAALVSMADFVITNTSLCMHLAGAFEIPALTLLGEWYDSAKTHHQQWGYPECMILGKEYSEGRTKVASPEEAFGVMEQNHQLLFHSNP
jgi:ADP-heptose:LPS heptosyltransferase